MSTWTPEQHVHHAKRTDLRTRAVLMGDAPTCLIRSKDKERALGMGGAWPWVLHDETSVKFL